MNPIDVSLSGRGVNNRFFSPSAMQNFSHFLVTFLSKDFFFGKGEFLSVLGMKEKFRHFFLKKDAIQTFFFSSFTNLILGSFLYKKALFTINSSEQHEKKALTKCSCRRD